MNELNTTALNKAYEIIDRLAQVYEVEVHHIITTLDDSITLKITSPFKVNYKIDFTGSIIRL